VPLVLTIRASFNYPEDSFQETGFVTNLMTYLFVHRQVYGKPITPVTVQSNKIHYKQGYDYIFRAMSDTFKPVSCNLKFLYLRYNAYNVSVFVIQYNVSSVSIKTCNV